MASVKRPLSILIICLAVTTLVIAGKTVNAQDVTATNDQPKDRCTLAQGYIKATLKPQDLRARVDRLQAYQYISGRLDEFVTRLERNHQPDSRELRATVNALNKAIIAFKSDYELYDLARDKVANLKDCKNHISQFQAALTVARDRRSKVNTDVSDIQNILSPTAEDQLTDLYNQLLDPIKQDQN